MKKRGRPETSQQPPTIGSLYYLYFQVAQFGTNPNCAVAVFDDLIEVNRVVGGVDYSVGSVGVNCYELYFHGESLLVVFIQSLFREWEQTLSAVSSRLQPGEEFI